MNIVEPIRSKEKLNEFRTALKERNYRDFVISEVGFLTGLRISDILPLKVSDVANQTHITIKEQKTGKHKRFLIPAKLQNILTEYIKEKGLEDSDYLFPSRKGTGLNPYVRREQIFKSLNEVAKTVGIKDKIGTHTLRKTFGYHHYQQYKDVAILQQIFNHSAPSITLKYIGITNDIIDNTLANFDL